MFAGANVILSIINSSDSDTYKPAKLRIVLEIIFNFLLVFLKGVGTLSRSQL